MSISPTSPESSCIVGPSITPLHRRDAVAFGAGHRNPGTINVSCPPAHAHTDRGGRVRREERYDPSMDPQYHRVVHKSAEPAGAIIKQEPGSEPRVLVQRPSHSPSPSSSPDPFAMQRAGLALFVGPQRVRIPVKYGQMAYASPVFENILLDGTEVDLPHDDAEAMVILCHVIHQDSDLIPRTLRSDKILSLAFLTHKYKCLRVVKLAGERWMMNSYGNVRTIDDAAMNVASAYIFEDHAAFRKSMKTLLWNADWNANNMYEDTSLFELPMHVTMMLDKQYHLTRNVLKEEINRYKQRSCKCGYWRAVFSRFMEKMRQESGPTLVEDSPSLKTSAKSWQKSAVSQKVPTEALNCGGSHAQLDKEGLRDAVNEMELTCCGICLKCALKKHPAAVRCREHDEKGFE